MMAQFWIGAAVLSVAPWDSWWCLWATQATGGWSRLGSLVAALLCLRGGPLPWYRHVEWSVVVDFR